MPCWRGSGPLAREGRCRSGRQAPSLEGRRAAAGQKAIACQSGRNRVVPARAARGSIRGRLAAGGAAPAVFNAANEQAVALFLEGLMTFSDISVSIEAALDRFGGHAAGDRTALLAVDGAARTLVRERV